MGWIGGGIAAFAMACWAAIAHFFLIKEGKSTGAASTSVSLPAAGPVSGAFSVGDGDLEINRQADEFGDNDALLRAIATYRAALTENTRERVPLQWAMIQHNIGIALTTLGEREGGTARFEEAIAAFRAALTERTRERVPHDWAKTQNNLGIALVRLGEHESGTAHLEEAIAAFRLAQTTPERVPLQWAMTQTNLGTALSKLGERESGTSRLNAAVMAHREALAETSRERAPLQWAMVQNNLGTALAKLGERNGGTVHFEEAVVAFRAALTEHTRERVPLQWAIAQNNLGSSLSKLGERESGTGRLEEAVTAFCLALTEHTRERLPLQWATIQNNLGTALVTLGERESGTGRLEEAVAAFRYSLIENTPERVPLQWAMTQHNLGTVLTTLGQRNGGTGRLEEAVMAFRAALTERNRESVPHDWAKTQNNLGTALFKLGQRESGTSHLWAAVSAYRVALGVWTNEAALYWCAMANRNLAGCLALLKQRRQRSDIEMEPEDNQLDDPVAVAEKYRRDRQTVDAKGSGTQFLALDEYIALLDRHKPALLSLARRSGAPTEQDAEIAVAWLMERVSSVPASDFDEVGVQMILIELVRTVEGACAELNLPVPKGIVYGTTHSPGVTARQKPVFDTGVSIVELGLPFITLCDLLSKLLAHTICTEEGDQIHFAMAPGAIRHRLRSQRWLMKEWRRLLLHYAVRDKPPRSLGRAPLGPILDVRRGLLDAMEIFIVAHEYSHHILQHGANEASVQPTSVMQDEYDADTLAHIISMQAASKGSLPQFLFLPSVCAAAILAILDVIARVRELLETGTDALPNRKDHPPAKQRLDALNHFDKEYLADHPAAAQTIADFRELLFEVIEQVWNELRPSFERLRRLGIRAQHRQGMSPLDWLPLA